MYAADQVVKGRRIGDASLQALEGLKGFVEHLEAEEELAEEETGERVVLGAGDAGFQSLDRLDRLLTVEEVLLEDRQEDRRTRFVEAAVPRRDRLGVVVPLPQDFADPDVGRDELRVLFQDLLEQAESQLGLVRVEVLHAELVADPDAHRALRLWHHHLPAFRLDPIPAAGRVSGRQPPGIGAIPR